MCVSINGPGDLELLPFDLETGMRVASKVENLHSEFGHARPSGSPVIRYVRDGRTDGQTKATLTVPFPTGGGIIIIITERFCDEHKQLRLTNNNTKCSKLELNQRIRRPIAMQYT